MLEVDRWLEAEVGGWRLEVEVWVQVVGCTVELSSCSLVVSGGSTLMPVGIQRGARRRTNSGTRQLRVLITVRYLVQYSTHARVSLISLSPTPSC